MIRTESLAWGRPLAAGLLTAALLCAGCVYRLNIQQGNLVDEEAIEQVEIGMTRSQVRFLLGTPMVDDPFHEGRWDYVYYFRRGRDKPELRHWLTVWFEDDTVSRIERGPPYGRDESG